MYLSAPSSQDMPKWWPWLWMMTWISCMSSPRQLDIQFAWRIMVDMCPLSIPIFGLRKMTPPPDIGIFWCIFQHQSTSGSSWWLVPLSLFIILGGSSQPITDCYLSNSKLWFITSCASTGVVPWVLAIYIYIIPFVIYQKHPTGWSMEKFRRRLGEKDDLSISSRPFLGSSYVYSIYILYTYIIVYIYTLCLFNVAMGNHNFQ